MWGDREKRFADRKEAGRALAERLASFRSDQPVILALPRGGVPVAFEVARELRAPLDVVVVRKLGVPWQPELAMGAVGEGGVRVLNRQVVDAVGIDPDTVEAAVSREREEVERRVRAYRGGRPAVPVEGRTVIVVDDGLATGSTAQAAVGVLRARGAGRVIVAVPVAPPETVRRLGEVADEVICLQAPAWFMAVGEWYLDFHQIPDEEVTALLGEAATEAPPSAASAATHAVSVDVGIPLPGDLTVPEAASGIVVFAHGSGSSRLSPRNRAVAEVLQAAGLATLLFDLLTDREAGDRANVFDVDLLGRRLAGATRWLRSGAVSPHLPVGYFGASTGAAAALWAAAELGPEVSAVVSRGGRPDLAGERLLMVTAPTLLIVGGRDEVVLDLNTRAFERLECERKLEVVAGATHLFEEPGTLEEVTRLAREWFVHHLGRARARVA